MGQVLLHGEEYSSRVGMDVVDRQVSCLLREGTKCMQKGLVELEGMHRYPGWVWGQATVLRKMDWVSSVGWGFLTKGVLQT